MEETSTKKFVKTKKVAMIVALFVFAAIILGMGSAIIAGLYIRNEDVGSVNLKITTYLNDEKQFGTVEYGLTLEKGLKDFVQQSDYQLDQSDEVKYVYEIENIGNTDVSWKILLRGEEAAQHLKLTYKVGATEDAANQAAETDFEGTTQKSVSKVLKKSEKTVVIVLLRIQSGEVHSGELIGNLAFSIAAVGG